MKTITTTILMTLCISVILFAYQSSRAAADSASPKPDEKPGKIEKPSPPKKVSPAKEVSPAEEAKTENKPPAEKPASAEKPIDFDKLPAFYKKCDDVFSKYVDKDGGVDYAKLRRKRNALSVAVRAIEAVEPLQYLKWSDKERMAFWINTHNIFTLKLVIDNYPIKARWFMVNYPKNSIMQIANGRYNRYFDVIDQEFRIREIESEALIDKYKDLRIIFSLTYASKSSAILADHVFVPSMLDKQLDEQISKYLSSEKGIKIDAKSKTVYLSSLFNLYKKNFVASEYSKIKKFRKHPDYLRAYLNFIYKHSDKKTASYLDSNDFTIKFMSYDWRLNEPTSK